MTVKRSSGLSRKGCSSRYFLAKSRRRSINPRPRTRPLAPAISRIANDSSIHVSPCRSTWRRYGNSSKVNVPLNGPVALDRHQVLLDEVRRISGLPEDQFERAISRLNQTVDRHFANGTYDRIFKGKWYATLLEAYLRVAFPKRGPMDHVGSKATAALLTTMDFGQDWASHLTDAVASALD